MRTPDTTGNLKRAGLKPAPTLDDGCQTGTPDTTIECGRDRFADARDDMVAFMAALFSAKDLFHAGDDDAPGFGGVDGFFVAGVHMAGDSDAGIVGEDALEADFHFAGSVGNDDLSGVEGLAHTDSAAMVEGDPGGSGGGVEHGVQEGPVGDGVGAVFHGFGFPVRGSYGTAVEVVAADGDGGFEFAGGDEFIDGDAEFSAFAVSQPADAGGESLEADFFAGHPDPAAEGLVVGELFEDEFIGTGDIVGIAGEGYPSEGAFTFTEEGPDVGRDESGEGESFGVAGFFSLSAEVVAVIEDDRSAFLQFNHGLAVENHRSIGHANVFIRIGIPQFKCFFVGDAVGDVAVQFVVGGGLVGDDVGDDAFFDEGGEDVGAVSEESDGQGAFIFLGCKGQGDGFVEVGFHDVEVLSFEAPPDAVFVNFDTDTDAVVHGDGHRLRSAHAAEAAGEGDFSRKIGHTEIFFSKGGEGFVGSLEDALGTDVDPGPGGHLAEHHEALFVQFTEVFPGGPVADQVGISDEYPGGVGMGAEYAHGFSGLDEESFVGFEGFKGG